MHSACPGCPNVSSTVVRLQKSGYIDRRQARVVEGPIFHRVIPIVHGLGGSDIHPPLASALMRNADDPFTCDGGRGQILPRFTCVHAFEHFVSILGARKNAPNTVWIDSIHFEINGLIVIRSSTFDGRNRSQ